MNELSRTCQKYQSNSRRNNGQKWILYIILHENYAFGGLNVCTSEIIFIPKYNSHKKFAFVLLELLEIITKITTVESLKYTFRQIDYKAFDKDEILIQQPYQISCEHMDGRTVVIFNTARTTARTTARPPMGFVTFNNKLSVILYWSVEHIECS